MQRAILDNGLYVVSKAFLQDTPFLAQIKKDLTNIIPFRANPNYAPPKGFSILLETEKYYLLPPYYGIQLLGVPEKDLRAEGLPAPNISLLPTAVPRDFQKKVIEECLGSHEEQSDDVPSSDEDTERSDVRLSDTERSDVPSSDAETGASSSAPIGATMGGTLKLGCAAGKCLGVNTEVLMYDNTNRKIKDVKVGDILVGDNFKPRYVKRIITGVATLYRIEDKKLYIKDATDGVPLRASSKTDHCQSYDATEDHILCLKDTEDKTVEISVKDYMRDRRFLNGYCTVSATVFMPYQIHVRYLGVGPYIGLEFADTDKRHLLHPYHIVVHNTFISLSIMAHFKKKALVIVNQDHMIQQWKDEIKKFLSPNISVGVLSSALASPKDFDISLSVINTIALSDKKYTENDFKGTVGIVIFDELHLYSTECFSKAFSKVISCRYIYGLSATPEREDRLDRIAMWYSGPTISHFTEQYAGATPIVNIINYTHPDGIEIFQSKTTGSMDFSTTVMTMCVKPERNILILNVIAFLHSQGKKVLAIGGVRTHLETLSKNLLKTHGIPSGIFYHMPKSHKEDLIEAKKKPVIFAIRNMGSQGLSIEDITALVLMIPMRKVEQVTGRILRRPHEKSPIIVDIIDQAYIFIKHGKMRKAYYKEKHYPIYTVNVEEDTPFDCKNLTMS